MRIIGGKYRGKKLPISTKLDLRPTTDFAKEGLFNVLNNLVDIEDARFLDLFAGTGNISYELISRGASGGMAVDISQGSHKYRERFKLEMSFDGLTNIRSEVLRFVRNHSSKFDLIFADPPYDFEKYDELVESVFQNQLLKADGVFVLEHPEEHTFEIVPQHIDSRKYGRVHFSFFKQQQ